MLFRNIRKALYTSEYKFVRWDGDISNITGNIDTKPIYEKIKEDSGNKNDNENAGNSNMHK